MSKIITKVIGLAVIAVVFTTALAAQSAFMPNERVDEHGMQLRADKKAWPEYQISYSPLGGMNNKGVFEYDEAGNLTLLETYRWVNNDWVTGWKVVYEYDAAGNQTLMQNYGVTSSGTDYSFVNGSKTITEYDAAGNQTLYEYYFWRDDSWVGSGNKLVYEYTDGERSKTLTYNWEDGDWVLTQTIGAFDMKPSYLIDGDDISFGFPDIIGNNSYLIFSYKYDEAKLNTEYDSNGNLTLFVFDGTTFKMEYDENNNVVSLGLAHNGDVVDYKARYEYNAAGHQTLYESHLLNVNGEWRPAGYRYVFTYDALGNRTSSDIYQAESGAWVLQQRGEEWKYDADGNRTYYRFQQPGYSYSYVYKYDDNGNEVASYYYDIIDGDMILGAYSISYPNYYEPEVYITNITEIGESNEGSFDITTSMSIDSIQGGSFRVHLPNSFSLNEEKTAIASGLADKFNLNITKIEGNSYLIDVAPKANTSNNGAGSILRIAYKIDEKLVRGTYALVVNNILFNTPGGDFLPTPATIVPAIVNRWGVSNEAINSATPKAYTANNTLYIYVAQTERIAVYSLTGIKLYETTVSAGTTTVNTAAFPQGVLIVKGNSGWARKVNN